MLTFHGRSRAQISLRPHAVHAWITGPGSYQSPKARPRPFLQSRIPL